MVLAGRLEPQLGEEIVNSDSLLLVLCRLVLVFLLEDLLQGLLGLRPLFLGKGSVVHALLEVEVHRVAGGHEVVKVDGLEERLDLRPLLNLGRLHVPHNLAGVAVDAGNHSVAKLLVLATLIRGLDHHGLTPGKTPR